MSLSTRLTAALDIKFPVILPPMANCGGGALAGSVSRAGGLGFIAAGYNAMKTLPPEIAIAKEILEKSPATLKEHRAGSKSIHLPEMLPIGVGFITFALAKLDQKVSSDGAECPYPALQLVLDSKVSSIWFSFGDCKRYIDYVRWKSPHTRIFVQAVNLQEAVTAASEWAADVIVLQGSESGGHGAAEGHGITTISFVPSAIQALSSDPATSRTLVCAAGGIATGQQLAAALALGAHGAAIGTRFLCSPEALYSQQAKEALTRTDDPLATVRTRVFDFARGSNDWPMQYDGRALRNKTTREESEINAAHGHSHQSVWPLPERQSTGQVSENEPDGDPIEIMHQGSEGGGRALARLKRLYQDAMLSNDVDRLVVWASQSVSLMNNIKPAAEIVEELVTDAVARIQAMHELVKE